MIKKIQVFVLISTMIFIVSCGSNTKNSKDKKESIRPETALQSYLDNGDDTYKWEIKNKYLVGETTAYDLLLTSQNWREHIWKHQLTLLVPKEIEYDGALLFVTAGELENNAPIWRSADYGKTPGFANMAEKNKAIVAIVRQVPNQPLYGGLEEDQLISFTLHNFKKDKDYSWPLLFPMVKSASRAMDAVQEFSKEKLHKNIKRFTVTGESKRGWTSWLIAAFDKRVEAIAPMVIDALNMPVSLDYQIKVWNKYSDQIADYTKLEIPQTVKTADGEAITTMVDPYSYRDKLDMPKLILIGTNDPYFPIDAIKNYIDDIPGENYIHYVPNTAHNLSAKGEPALVVISGFWAKTLMKKPYNEINYQISSNNTMATLYVKSSSDDLLNIYFWSADSEDRDFRDEKWELKSIRSANDKEVKYKIPFPEKGFKAFYIDMEFANPNGGKYTKSTRMYVVDNKKVL